MRFIKSVLAVVLVLIVTSYGAVTDNVPPIQDELPGVDGLGVSKEINYAPGEIIVKFKKPVADKLRGLTVEKPSLSPSLDNLSRKYNIKKVEQVIKGFKDKTQEIAELSKKSPAALTASQRHLVMRAKRAPKGSKAPDLGSMYLIKLGQGQSESDAVSDFSKDPDVEYAELNYSCTVYATEPDDPNYREQWALRNVGQLFPWDGNWTTPPGTPDKDIDANDAWDIFRGGGDAITAVLDTGADYKHSDLSQNILLTYGYDYFNKDGDPLDDNGHGTHCSGIIGAQGNNGYDVSGINWNTKIMAVKWLNKSGGGYTGDAALAIHYAVDNGAEILSNSWGVFNPFFGPINSKVVRDAVAYAVSEGAIFIAAAGNDYRNWLTYPASYNNVISVAATDCHDNKAAFSNYGEWVDIAAPGADILSLRAAGTDMYEPDCGCPGAHFYPYGDPNATMYIASGTSMACPQVAGACAMMLALNPELGYEDVNDILAQTADPIANGICHSDGRINLYQAMRACITSKGYINLESDQYNSNSDIQVYLVDGDLAGNDSQDVSITTSGGDSETVTLYKTPADVGVFTGTIVTASGTPITDNNIVEISDGQIITASYADADDGSGSSAEPNDTAKADFMPPQISVNFEPNPRYPEMTITFDTNEPAFCRLLYGTSCENTENVLISMGTHHVVKFVMPFSYTNYYFKIEATDAVNNSIIDNNDGNCYRFTSDGPNTPINVPADFNTIQEAIDHCWDGGTVIVAQGTYFETIYFNGKPITVRSTDPDNWDVVAATIIDANYLDSAVVFRNNEGADSILEGFTVQKGDGYGDCGIHCLDSAPTIRRCIIQNCNYKGIYCLGTGLNTIITDNIIRNNDAFGIYCYAYSSPIITNNLIYGNNNDGIASQLAGTVTVRNNTIINNGRGISESTSSTPPAVSNCILWGNGDDLSACTATYSCIEDGDAGTGNISTNPLFEPNDNLYHLRPGSPCIDAANNTGVDANETDIDNQPRIQHGAVDMGGDEFVRVYNQTQRKCYSTIQSAINDSVNGNKIVVYPGTYLERISFGGKTITVSGSDPNNWDVVAATIIDANYLGHTVTFIGGEGTSSRLEGFTIQKGDGDMDCGIYCNAAPTIRRCIIQNNNYKGIHCLANALITDNIIRNNSIGIYPYAFAAPTITNNLLYGNSSSGIATFIAGAVKIRNNTIVNNGQSGVRNIVGTAPAISNCILWGNGDDLSGCSVTYSCIEDGDAGTGNISSNPLFEPNDSFYHLTPDSPCINAGSNTSVGTGEQDIDNQIRIQGGTVDMGSDEAILVRNQTQDQWYTSIQSAIDVSNNGDVIVISPGTYYEKIDDLGKALTIRSTDPNNWAIVEDTIIDGNGDACPIVSVDEGSILAGLTIRNGDDRGEYAEYASIYCYRSTIGKCIIDAGAYGVSCNASTVEGSIIRNQGFAGVNLTGGWSIIRNNMIYDNFGGIMQTAGNWNSQVINNTIAYNNDSGVYVSSGTAPFINNCIIWNNTDDLINCTATYSCISNGDSGTGNISSNPLFENIAGDDYHISSSSPCRLAGDPSSGSYYAGWKDFDNENRYLNGSIDLGADQYWP